MKFFDIFNIIIPILSSGAFEKDFINTTTIAGKFCELRYVLCVLQ